jgi:YVTN family beta-propeller protein
MFKKSLSVLSFFVFLFLNSPVLSAQSVLQFPRVIATNDVYTGIAVGNPTTAEASVTLTAYLPDGSPLAAAKNPVAVTIPPAGQLAKTFSELFGVASFNGWVQATSSTAGLTGFFLNLNNASTDMDGAGSTVASSDILLPLAAEDSVARTEVTIVNVNQEAATAAVTLYSDSGAVLLARQVSLPPRGLIRQTLSVLFNAADFSAASHLRVRSDRPVIAHEVIADYLMPGANVRRETGALTGHDPSPSTTTVLPQLTTGGGWISLIGLVNGSGIAQDVTLYAYKDDGTLSSNPRQVTLAGNGALRMTAQDLFGFSPDTLTTGWIQVSSTLGYVTSFVGYGNLLSPSFAMVEGTPSGNATRNAVFSHVAEGAGFYTGLTVVNPGDESADVEFYTLQADGSTVGKLAFTVGPHEHTARLFRELLPASLGQLGGWGYLRSSKPVVAAVLFGSSNGFALANVPQQLPAADFLPPPQTTASITGSVRTGNSGVAGVDVQLKGPVNTTVVTDDAGRYVFSRLPAGDYKVSASKGSTLMTPVERSVTLARVNVDGVNFEAQGGTDAGAPVISFVSPTSAFVGSTSLSMRVLGSNFTPFSQVRLNDQGLLTTFVSALELRAVVPASLLAQPSAMKVVVYTPPPGGGVSAALNFTVSSVPTNPLIAGFSTVGAFPAGVAIDESRHQALVSNEGTDTVSVVDIPSLRSVKEIRVGRSPAESIAIHQGKDLAIVANSGDNTVSIINLVSQVEQRKITVGRLPIGVAVNPKTNRAYVVHASDDNVWAIDLDTFGHVGTFSTGAHPTAIAINTNTNQAIVSNRNGNSVSILDLSASTQAAALLGTVNVGRSPRGVAVNEDTNTAVVVNTGDNSVMLIDLNSRTLRGTAITVGTAPTDVGIHRITNNAVVTNSFVTTATATGAGTSNVTILNLDDRETLATIPVGNGAFGVGIDQTRQEAVIANFFGENVTVIRIPNPQPKISDIQPRTFPVGGGSFTITVKGTGFVPTSVLTLNGQALPTNFISTTELSGTVSGAVLDQLLQISRIDSDTGKSVVSRIDAPQFNVGVSNPCPPCGDDGGSSPPNTNPNTQIQPQNPAPVLLSMSPNESVVGNDLGLTLSGTNFNATSVINFGGLQLRPDAVSLTSLTVNIPRAQLAAGDVPVSVSNPAPGGGVCAVLIFTVIGQSNPLPAVTTVTPGSVTAGSGAVLIQVTGTGFISSTTATLAGVPGVVSGNTITFALTDAMTANPGTLSGFVTNPEPGGGSATFSVNVLSSVPTIIGFTPSSANAGSISVSMTVTGSNFRNGTVITVAGTPIPTTFVSSTQLTGLIPETFLRRSGEFRIGVTNPPPGGGSAEGGLFNVTSPLPVLTSVSPSRTVVRNSPLTVQLTGTNFATDSRVFIGSTRLDAVFNSATSLSATIPAEMMSTPRVLDLVVTNPPPGGGTSAPRSFTVENSTPVIETVSPNPIPSDLPSAVITVTGQNFLSGAVVRFGDLSLLTTLVSSTRLLAVVPPPLVFGRYAVTVINPAPSTPSNSVDVEIGGLRPVIDDIGPRPARPGQLIRIAGRNFGPTSVILQGGVVAFPTVYVDPFTLTGVLPEATSPGAYDLTVLNPGNVALVSDVFTLNVFSPVPAIQTYTPESGVSGSTVSFVINGTNFFEGAAIHLDGVAIATTFVDFNKLTGTATLGSPGTVTLTVVNTGGFTSNSVPFTISPSSGPGSNPSPAITGIFPGGALVGSSTLSLNISGTGYSNLTTVTFGGTAVTITSQTATTLTVTIPAALMTTAGTRLVMVTNPSPGGGSASTSFVVNSFEISPVLVERIPGGTQQFTLVNPPSGTFIWSVNGLDGGNSTFGPITSSGFYTAPSVVPSPASFPVCARLSTDSTVKACATVTVNSTPTAGSDLVVFNDVNPFDNARMTEPNNKLMARNLVNFTGAGPRATGSVVQFDCGRNTAFPSICTGNGSTMIGEMVSQGLTVTIANSSAGSLTSIPSNVKAIFLWLPTVAYTPAEVNTLKNFANEGGRIVFIGEHSGFYGTSIPLQNDFLTKMGAVMRNVGQAIDSGLLPASQLRPHQITTGMTGVSVAASSVITLGPNDFPLYYSVASPTDVLAGVAKIDVSPLPTAAPTVTAVSPSSGATGASTNVTITGTNFLQTCSGCPIIFGTTISAGSNVAVTNIVFVNSTTITATFTPGFNATPGANPVTATTQNGSGGGASFNVTSTAGTPVITNLNPNSGGQNSSVTVTITGTNFTGGATVGITGSGVTPGTPNVTSSTTMTVQFTIASNAPEGARAVTVTTPGGTSNQATFVVTVSSVFNTFHKTWVGGQSGAPTDFENAGNWAPGGVPAMTDNVLIPGGLSHQPVLNGTMSVNDLYLGTGATLTITADVNGLIANGNVNAGDRIDGLGVLVMTGTSKLIQGTVENLYISGTISGMGNVIVHGDMLVMNAGSYTIAGHNVDVRRDFATVHTATLIMTNPTDYIQIAGNAFFGGGSTSGKLTNGAIELHGDIVQTVTNGPHDTFAASGSHITRFVGSVTQNVGFLHTGVSASHFQNVEIQNGPLGSVDVSSFTALALGNLELKTADSKLTGTGSFTANGDLPAFPIGAQISIANLKIGGNVDGVQPIGAGSTTLTMEGAGKTLTGTVNGYVVITGTVSAGLNVSISRGLSIPAGSFDLNSNIVNVGEDLSVTGTGTLKMIQNLARLNVRDATFAGGSTDGLLTAGLLTVKRDFTQSNAGGQAASFAASGNHTVQFIGNQSQNVVFATSGLGPGTSHFNVVDIATVSGGQVVIVSGNDVQTFDLYLTAATSKLVLNGILRVDGALLEASGSTIVNRPNLIHTQSLLTETFESSVNSGWSSALVSTTPVGGRKFLGEFGTQTVNLALASIPSHSSITVSFDLYVLKSWDGNGVLGSGPDTFDFGVTGAAAPLLHTSFGNYPGQVQAFPGTHPGPSNSDGTGASERNTLGYSFYGDTVYRLTYTFAHTASSLTLNFAASLPDGDPGLHNESWGLDNVVVRYAPAPAP